MVFSWQFVNLVSIRVQKGETGKLCSLQAAAAVDDAALAYCLFQSKAAILYQTDCQNSADSSP